MSVRGDLSDGLVQHKLNWFMSDAVDRQGLVKAVNNNFSREASHLQRDFYFSVRSGAECPPSGVMRHSHLRV